MLTLGNIFVLMLLAAAAAWVWHNHGLRERALERVKQHCAKLDIELLDGAVALKRIGFVKDANGRRRLARRKGVAAARGRCPCTVSSLCTSPSAAQVCSAKRKAAS